MEIWNVRANAVARYKKVLHKFDDETTQKWL